MAKYGDDSYSFILYSLFRAIILGFTSVHWKILIPLFHAMTQTTISSLLEIMLSGNGIKGSTKEIESRSVKEFAANNYPGINDITQQIDNIINIYSYITQICFDDK